MEPSFQKYIQSLESVRVAPGLPSPLGANLTPFGTNIAIVSKNATEVSLVLFLTDKKKFIDPTRPQKELRFDPKINKTGNVWHLLLDGLIQGEWVYGFRLDGPNNSKNHQFNKSNILGDPYATELASSFTFGKGLGILGHLSPLPSLKALQRRVATRFFPHKPKIPIEKLVIYEMHIRGFTIDPSSKVNEQPGTFLAAVEKIPYLKSLGINCIELMPIFEFNELLPSQLIQKLSNPSHSLCQFWGYNTLNFFTPMKRFSSFSEPDLKIQFRKMVDSFHDSDIEVILDVVFNHSSEGEQDWDSLNFRGIDNDCYYMHDENGNYINVTGCGNTLNCNHGIVRQLIHESCRYWVSEMGVDGFRFDLCSSLLKGSKGEILDQPHLIASLSEDPILADTKLIAEPWDLETYNIGSFPKFGSNWSEWNDKFRDITREWIKGTATGGQFATVFCGSQNLYHSFQKGPAHSINFITAHDGFTLYDLFSYNSKHNLENGEQGKDGNDSNHSWNHGFEGETDDKNIKGLRQRQLKNSFVYLLFSIGIPMIVMGDEYGHTKNGNNNTWSQDNRLNYFLWDKAEQNPKLINFIRFLIKLRLEIYPDIFCRTTFLNDKEIIWHGENPTKAPIWDKTHFIAITLKDGQKRDLHIAFNAQSHSQILTIPSPPYLYEWRLLFDTNHDLFPFEKFKNFDFLKCDFENGEEVLESKSYKMNSFSIVVLQAVKGK